MVEYIKNVVRDLVRISQGEKVGIKPSYLFTALAEEVNRLDPRDFLPEAQYEFVKLRLYVRYLAGLTTIQFTTEETKKYQERCNRLIVVLDKYGGEGSRAITRDFSFVTDPDLRTIVERDYRELSLRVFPSGAWKSVVIMAGSILEAILYDVLTKDAATLVKTKASREAPPTKFDIMKGEWKLEQLIKVAADVNVIPAARADSIDQVLRDYRNFVHPKKELRSAHPCSEAEAYMAKGALDGVCNHLSP